MNPSSIAHILLVEDDENDCFFFERAAARAGVAVGVVHDGQQAIQYLSGLGAYADRQAHPFPGIVVLDLNLPVKPGLEVLKWIRTGPGTRHLVVLVLTSSIDVLDLHQAYSLGANSYLVKPSDPIELAGVVAAIKAYWFSYNTPPPVPVHERSPAGGPGPAR